MDFSIFQQQEIDSRSFKKEKKNAHYQNLLENLNEFDEVNSDLEMTLTLIYLSLKSFVYEMNVGSEEVKMLIVIEDSIMKMMMKQSKDLTILTKLKMKKVKIQMKKVKIQMKSP
ncbi:MAG: hypothetical protein EZS28_002462 [Streblomastix strix]|uniref:Uncharacterized protein n=1 Tax=Streblomastix strix TaxID=222440 RepID=A0A5J4X5V7_9EUKA|nr:MAG: hypothetical protein EZS28_002462 [Streblomastix strix]